MRYTVSPSWIVALGLAATVGCGDQNGESFEVSGTVTYRGDSVQGGTLLLQPGSGRSIVTTIDQAGRYSVVAPAGTYQLAVVSATKIPDAVDPWKSKSRLPAPLVPDKFGHTETSGLEITVPQAEDQPIDITLE